MFFGEPDPLWQEGSLQEVRGGRTSLRNRCGGGGIQTGRGQDRFHQVPKGKTATPGDFRDERGFRQPRQSVDLKNDHTAVGKDQRVQTGNPAEFQKAERSNGRLFEPGGNVAFQESRKNMARFSLLVFGYIGIKRFRRIRDDFDRSQIPSVQNGGLDLPSLEKGFHENAGGMFFRFGKCFRQIRKVVHPGHPDGRAG